MSIRFARAILAICMASLLWGCNGPATYITRGAGTVKDTAAPGGYARGELGNGLTYPTGPDTSAFAGVLVNGSVGQGMDEADRIKITQTLEMCRANYTIRWHNPNTGIEYAVTPARTYETASGPCREFTAQAVIDGQRQSAQGSACRQSSGVWQASPYRHTASD